MKGTNGSLWLRFECHEQIQNIICALNVFVFCGMRSISSIQIARGFGAYRKAKCSDTPLCIVKALGHMRHIQPSCAAGKILVCVLLIRFS